MIFLENILYFKQFGIGYISLGHFIIDLLEIRMKAKFTMHCNKIKIPFKKTIRKGNHRLICSYLLQANKKCIKIYHPKQLDN